MLYSKLSKTHLQRTKRFNLLASVLLKLETALLVRGRNPQTGAEIDIPATKIPAFKPGKGLKEAVK